MSQNGNRSLARVGVAIPGARGKLSAGIRRVLRSIRYPSNELLVRLFTHGKAGIAFIMIAVLLDVLSLGVVIPVLPKLIAELLDDNTAEAAGYVGVFGTIWACMQFFSSPIIGALSDRFGRRPVLFNLGVRIGYRLHRDGARTQSGVVVRWTRANRNHGG